jgi:hypothetical protein
MPYEAALPTFVRFLLFFEPLLMGFNCPLLHNVDLINLGVVCIVNAHWLFLSFLMPSMWLLELLSLGFNVDFPFFHFSLSPINSRVKLREPRIAQQNVILTKIGDIKALEGLFVFY